MKLIEVNHLSKKIHGKDILKDISFTINDGECVALIGPNGAGKTTLMDCLLGDKFLTSGQASVRGLKPTDEQLKQIVAILPQENTVVADLKVKELLNFFQSIYPRSLTNQEVDALLTFTDKQKDQLASKLSGGQKQRIALARALLTKSPILILDEATSGLDVLTEKKVIDNLMKLPDKTIIFVAHHLSISKRTNQIIVLDQGKVIETGSHTELIGRKGFYYHLFNK